ncbi:IS5 family transposase [Dactylosporangium sp. CA-152071]|uniref:IS5 family transposase n=1 Tax=Dactylosporangium sp. CA-152071 TaxID=3239933 RepID=UPI003D902C5F
MPALPSSLFEPVWVQFAALWPEQPEFDPSHPLGCHRRRIPDRVVFEHVIAALVHGSGYERVASDACSDRTIRRRLRLWADAGLGEQVHELALDAYDRMIGLDLTDVSADGAITKAPCGGDRAGRSPVDRGKGGMKRSTGVDGYGIPLGMTGASANRHDSPLLRDTFEACSTQLRHRWPEQVTAHLDRGYDNNRCRDLLDELGFDAQIARKGVPAPIQIGKRWVVERTNSWMNSFGKIRRCTDRDATIVDFYLYLAAAIVTIRQLIQRARTLYRWDTRPTTRRLK